MALICFGVILDDIVHPDGRTDMGVLGGGGPQTAFGLRLWAEPVILSASVGDKDFDRVARWCMDSRVETTCLRRSNLPTLRAWQVLEWDGTRTQVWRVPGQVIGSQLQRKVEHFSSSTLAGSSCHFGIHPENYDPGFASSLKAAGCTVSVETFKAPSSRMSPEQIGRLFTAADIFSTNLSEARMMTGLDNPLDILRYFLDISAPLLTLRMGEQGSLVLDPARKTALQIPAVPVNVVSPVGAGNAYCGGFLAGWTQEQDVRTAGLFGAVSASFLLEQVGTPACTPSLHAIASTRQGMIVDDIKLIQL